MSNSPEQIIQISLPPQLSEEQRQLLVAQAKSPRNLTQPQWVAALATFDLLHTGRVSLTSETRTFKEFYFHTIEAAHATSFIEQLEEIS